MRRLLSPLGPSRGLALAAALAVALAVALAPDLGAAPPPPAPPSPSPTAAPAGSVRLWWIFLVKGDKSSPPDPVERQKRQDAHIGNFQAQFAAGRLISAGPLSDPTKVRRGIVVLRVPTEADVLKCFETDPYIQEGIMKVVARPWDAPHHGIHTEGIDAEKIVENRLAVLSGELSEGDRAWLDARAASHELNGWGRLGEPGPPQAILLFEGTTDREPFLKGLPGVAAGKVTYEVIPLWQSPGVLRTP